MAYQAGTAFVSILPSLRGFQTKLESELRGMRVNKDIEVGVKVDTDRATAGMTRLTGATNSAHGGLSRLVGSSNNASNGLGRTGRSANSAGSGLGRLAAVGGTTGSILLGVGAAAGVAVAGLAAIPGVAFAAAGAVGVFAGAFHGVGDALKGYQEDQDAAASATRKGSTEAAANARQIRDAQQQIGDARKNQARVAADSARRVADAERNQADVAERGAEQLQAAHEKVNGSLADEERAQQRLTDARQDAIRTLDDLRERTSDYALTEEDASISVERARERLNKVMRDATASDLDRREASLNLRQAEERLSDVQRERAQSAQELAVAERKGVDGADVVVAAQRDVADAHANVQKAQQDLGKTQAQVDRDNQDAARAVADARTEAAQAQEDAAIAVARAMQGLKDVQDQQAESAAGAAAQSSKYAEAMAKLTPAQREFVKQLIAMRDPLKKLGDAGAGEFLPGLTQMLKDSGNLFPIFEGSLQRTGKLLGDTARKFGELFKSDEFKQNLDTALRAAEPITKAIGDSAVRMTDKLVEFAAKMAPASAGFATFLGDLTTGMEGFFTALEPRADVFRSIWESLGRISAVVLPALGEAAGKIADVLGPTLESVAGFLERNKDSLDEWVLSLLALYATLKGAKVVASVAAWTSGVTGKVADMGAKIGLSGGQVGLALAGITAAAAAGIWVWDQLRSKAGEYAVAVANGSMTFQQAVDDELRRIQLRQAAYEGMQGEGYATGKLIGEVTGKIDSNATALQQEEEAVRSVTEALEKHLGTLSPLEVAKARVAVAEGIYNDKLREFGPLADETKVAQERLSQAVNDEELAQQAAKLATQDHTDALKAQQDQILGSMSADLANRQALHELKKAQDAAEEATRKHGAGSDEAKEAGFRLEAAQLRVVESSKRLALETSGATTETQKNKASADAQMGAMLNLAATMGKNASPAVQQYARDLQQSDLDAYNATVRTSGFAYEVKKLPDGREVLITTPGLPEARAGIQGLQQDILKINGKDVSIFVSPLGKGGVASAGRLATGGILPGYTPGRDVHTFVSRTAGALHLSGGEAVMRPEWTAAVGARFVNGANAAARAGGVAGAHAFMAGRAFAAGGVVPLKLNVSYDDQGLTVGSMGAGVGASLGAFTGQAAGGVQRWAGLVAQALAMLGQPATLVQTTLRRMNQESGGNPRAINLWDSNAKRGTPSKGLMQVIDPTFRAYRDPRAANDVWDPLANVLASMRYAMRRYGSLPAAYNKPGGYDSGGWLPPGLNTVYNGTGKPEPVLTRDQLDALMGAATGGGGDTYVINPSAPLDEVQVARETSRIQQFNRRLAV